MLAGVSLRLVPRRTGSVLGFISSHRFPFGSTHMGMGRLPIGRPPKPALMPSRILRHTVDETLLPASVQLLKKATADLGLNLTPTDHELSDPIASHSFPHVQVDITPVFTPSVPAHPLLSVTVEELDALGYRVVESQSDFRALGRLLYDSYEMMELPVVPETNEVDVAALTTTHKMAYIEKPVNDMLMRKSTVAHLMRRVAEDNVLYVISKDQKSCIGFVQEDYPSNYDETEFIRQVHAKKAVRVLQFTVSPELRQQGRGRQMVSTIQTILATPYYYLLTPPRIKPEALYMMSRRMTDSEGALVFRPDFTHFLPLTSRRSTEPNGLRKPPSGFSSVEEFNDTILHDVIADHISMASPEKYRQQMVDRACFTSPAFSNALNQATLDTEDILELENLL